MMTDAASSSSASSTRRRKAKARARPATAGLAQLVAERTQPLPPLPASASPRQRASQAAPSATVSQASKPALPSTPPPAVLASATKRTRRKASESDEAESSSSQSESPVRAAAAADAGARSSGSAALDDSPNRRGSDHGKLRRGSRKKFSFKQLSTRTSITTDTLAPGSPTVSPLASDRERALGDDVASTLPRVSDISLDDLDVARDRSSSDSLTRPRSRTVISPRANGEPAKTPAELESLQSEKRERNRQAIAHEILSSEQNFLAFLQKIDEHFRQPLLEVCKSDDIPLREDHVRQLFGNHLDVVINMSKTLLAKLQPRYENFDNKTTKVADVFMQMVSYMGGGVVVVVWKGFVCCILYVCNDNITLIIFVFLCLYVYMFFCIFIFTFFIILIYFYIFMCFIFLYLIINGIVLKTI